MRKNLLCLLSVVALAAGCRSGDNPSRDGGTDGAIAHHDLSVGDILDASVDAAGIDAAGIDAANDAGGGDAGPPADMLTPLFAPAASFDVETGPLYLATADLNGDGKRDLIVVNVNDPAGNSGTATPSTFSLLLGNGDGTFQAKTSTNIDDYPFSVALADVNKDDKIDVVIATYVGIDVLLGTGNGTFAAPVQTIIGPNSAIRGAQIADMNGDGKLDVVAIDFGDGVNNGLVWILGGVGDGTFGTPVSFPVSGDVANTRSPTALRLGQLDNDSNSRVDVVTSNITNDPTVNSISVLTNSSTSTTFSLSAATEITAGKTPTDVLIEQLDGANKADIVVANSGDDSVLVYLSDSSTVGTISYATPVSYAAGSGPTALAYADVDGDTKVDLIVADGLGSTVTVIYGGDAGAFALSTATRSGSETYPVGMDPVSVVTGTFNSDTKVDVATANQNSNNVSILINQR